MPILSPLTNRFEKLYTSLCTESLPIRRLFCPIGTLMYADDPLQLITPDTTLVLPPSDYWVQRVKLNVKSEQEAIKYGPALFDLGDDYGFQAQKSGEDHYIIVAYNKILLSQKLHDTPTLATAKKLTFSQWIFADLTQPIALKNNKYLTVVDGIVIEMDSAYLNTQRSISMSEALITHKDLFYKTLSTHLLLPEQIKPKTLKITLAVLVVLLLNLITQIVLDLRLADETSENIETILASSHLPETSIEREAIVNALTQKEVKQLRLRQQCYTLSTLPLKVSKAVAAPAPATLPASSASSEGIVLIPGSKPGDPNRLLVEGSVSAANTASIGASGFEELFYDGNTLKVRIDVLDSDNGESLKNEVIKRLKSTRVELREHQVEVRLK